MKPGIHPEFYANAKITCTACGAVFTIPGTVKELHTEVCSHCHPVYTGKHRGALTSGRVERFQKKLAAAQKAPPKTVKLRKLSPEEKLERKLAAQREKLARPANPAPARRGGGSGEKAAKKKKTEKAKKK